MSYEHWLQTSFVVGAFLWFVANLFFGQRYMRTLAVVRDPRRAPFVASAAWLGFTNLATSAYYIWVLFFPPQDLEIRKWLIFVIPADLAIGAISFMVIGHWVMRREGER